MKPPRSIREIAALISDARDILRRAIQSVESIAATHPSLPATSMKLQATRELLKEPLEDLLKLE